MEQKFNFLKSAFFRYYVIGNFLNSVKYALIIKKRVNSGFSQCCCGVAVVPKLGTTANYEKSTNDSCFAIKSQNLGNNRDILRVVPKFCGG
jgi:hypothetical protein